MAKPRTSNTPPLTTEYFTGLAGVYDEFRPSYPDAAIAWILSGLRIPIRAADLGCGTGISARLLARRGVEVIGIDPNQSMLDEAKSRTPAELRIEFRQGVGEHTGLEDESADLVLCAQSFHWFDHAKALREFHRVLRPGGRLALMWNFKDAREPFSAEFTRITKLAESDAAARGMQVHPDRSADPTLGGFFINPRERWFDNPQLMKLEGVLGRARSASYFPKADPLKSALERELVNAFEMHQRHGTVTLAHRTTVTLADRRD